MLRAAIVGLVVVSFASTATAPAAPKRADSCDAVRKRQVDLVKRLAATEQRLADALKIIEEMNAEQRAMIERLQEEKRRLNAKLR